MNRFVSALIAKYQSKIEEGLANIELSLNNSINLDNNTDIVNILDKYITMVDNYQNKLNTLNRIFIKSSNESN